ncbi:endonuclease [Roseibium aquae]|uniref:Endonuclease n=1 Tax=Roseibium aquae TaxID=1323746 RepID=A0A916TBM6_9HYPH|nr:endonuclease/exonuclease/phosphatase family protein [Roseibium aquae]GGB38755.1 endonuclease [Roseibium aquae]
MRIATFNLESFGDNRFDRDRLAPRIAVFRPHLLDLNADILCLQEVNAQKKPGQRVRCFAALDALLEQTPYASFHRAHSTRPGESIPADRHNLIILSRYPILERRVLHSTHVHPPHWQMRHGHPAPETVQPVLFDRPLLYAKLDAGLAKPLHVFCVHLRAPIAAPIPGGKVSAFVWRSAEAWAEGYFLASLKHTAQSLDLRLAIDTIFSEDPQALILAAGDFNAGGETNALRLVRAPVEDTGNPELASRELLQLDARIPRQERQTVIHDGRGQTLDHILASRALEAHVRSIRIFNAGLADEVRDAGSIAETGSFHAAVEAEFDFAPRSNPRSG